MSRTSRHFISLLKVEFEDIKSDLRAMEELLVSRIGLRQITDYVYNENTALLEREIAGVDRLRSLLDALSCEELDYPVEELAVRLEARFAEEIRRRQIPEAVHPLVTRRLHKVAGFIAAEEVVER
ncbi:MAG: hypothetical protein ACOC25_09440 [Alkalispirochaetaceae bacterium]